MGNGGEGGRRGRVVTAAALVMGASMMAAVAVLWRRVLFSRSRSRVVGIIPARYASSRFPGKPLALILGKSMIQRTWEQAKLATTLDAVVVATDDERIADACKKFGAEVVMTSEACVNGTERCQEALQKLKKKYDIVVNIQGDEPLVDPEIINGVAKALQVSPDAVFSTAVTALQPEDAMNPNRVKCVVDKQGYAIYFSRGLLPFNKSSKLEEDLEQLKVLENGYKMKVIKVDHEAHGVDEPADIAKIEALMKERNLS